MFLPEGSDELRQGDLLDDQPLPFWRYTDFELSGRPGEAPQSARVSVVAKGLSVPVVLCSHDCDLENHRNRYGWVVAPVLPWPFPDIADDASLDLISSARMSENNEYGYIHLFPIQIPGADADWRVVDFSALISVGPPSKIRRTFLGMKRFEMDDATREEFRLKLAASFGR